MKKWIAAACMLTMTASLLTACGQSGSGAEEAAQPDDMVQRQAVRQKRRVQRKQPAEGQPLR